MLLAQKEVIMGQSKLVVQLQVVSILRIFSKQILGVALACAFTAPTGMAQDGIDLTVEQGTGPGMVHLLWTGGSPPFGIHRSDDPRSVLGSGNQLGQTDGNDWSDFPPPTTPIAYYLVTNPVSGCPPGQTPCSTGCVDLSSDLNNCGTCGVSCVDPSSCTNDLCVGSTCRNVDLSRCLYADPNNMAPVDPARCGPSGCGVCNFATLPPGCNNTDSDGDGLGDAWEDNQWIDLDCDGNLDPNNDVELPGADRRVKDVYLKMSAMENSPVETIPDFHKPSEEAIRRVVAAFGGSHLTTPPVRCDASPTSNCPPFSICSIEDFVCLPTCTSDAGCATGVCVGGMCRLRRLHFDRAAINLIPHTKVVFMGPVQTACITGGDPDQGVNFYDIKSDPVNFDPKKSLFTHYGLFAHFNSCDGTSTCSDVACPGVDGITPDFMNSGLAEVHGNDFVVTLGEATFAFTATQKLLHEGGSVLHELGHNLGLRHGGPDCSIPCPADPNQQRKVNYLSVMNYTYNFGIPVTDTAGSIIPSSDLSAWRLDFSHRELLRLEESCLDESSGVAPGNPPAYDTDLIQYYDPNGVIRYGSTAPGRPIDWNGNSFPFESCVAVDINNWPPGGMPETHPGSEDWSSLNFAFQCSTNFVDGARPLTAAETCEEDVQARESSPSGCSALPSKDKTTHH